MDLLMSEIIQGGEMKRLIVIFLAVVLCFALFSCGAGGNVVIIRSESFFNEFKVEDGKTSLLCSITVRNNLSYDAEFTLSAKADKADVSSGLFRDGSLADTSTEPYKLKAGEKKTFEVTFTGENGGGAIKNNKLLPQISVYINKEKGFISKVFGDIDTDRVTTDKTSLMNDGYDVKSKPVGATLYVNGKAENIPVTDKRVVAALNIYQTSLLKENYYISQGAANDDYFKMECKNDRLEIEFKDGQPCDRLIITGKSYYLYREDSEAAKLYGYNDGYVVFEVLPYEAYFDRHKQDKAEFDELYSSEWIKLLEHIG